MWRKGHSGQGGGLTLLPVAEIGGGVSAASALIAGVELGGTKCVLILARGPDTVLEICRIPTTTPADTLGAIARQLEAWRGARRPDAIGIASFGPLDLVPGSAGFGRVLGTPKPGWSGADILGPLSALGLPAAIETDVNGAALAEARWGGGRGLGSIAYVTVGTGVGVGLLVDGRPLHGFGHPEAGHLRVGRMPGDDWPGACPFHGDCVEGLAAGPSITARAGAPAEALPTGHPAWDGVAHALGGLCATLALVAAPHRVLMGGGVMAAAGLIERIRDHAASALGGYAGALGNRAQFDEWIAPPALGAMAGPLGAVAVGTRLV